MANLLERIKALETAGNNALPSVKTLLARIAQYGFRRTEDFDKYDTLRLSEQLATASRLRNDDKAAFYDAIAATLRDKLLYD